MRIIHTLALTTLVLAAQHAVAGERTQIVDVSLTRPSIDATAGDSTTLSASFRSGGRATAAVFDRDGFPVRTLGQKAVGAGKRVDWTWDGRDDKGLVVADEAYSFRIDWTNGKSKESYVPANKRGSIISIKPKYYDRRGGTLAYELPVPCRVHIQAGTTAPHQSDKDVDGAILKTVVNRQPRGKGAIAEHWDGFDASGSIFVPDLPKFVVAIAATPLPENSVITYGNRQRHFIDDVGTRQGRSILAPPSRSHAHHGGLQTLDDLSPDLHLEVLDAQWSAAERAWIVTDRTVQIEFAPTGPAAGHFLQQPGTIYTFLNNKEESRMKAEASRHAVAIHRLEPGMNVITLNWSSEWGPVAANSLRILLKPAGHTSQGETRR